jgi:HK97 family phage major capsid protein
VSGQNLVSRQLLDMSPIDVDAILFSGLAQEWAAKQDNLALYGTGSSGQFTGIDNLAGITTIGWAGNTIANIYNGLTAAIKAHWAARFAAPTHLLIHPSTWTEWLAHLDTNNRPLIVPSAQGPYNSVGIVDNLNAEGSAGSVLGLQVVLDPNLSTSGGVSSAYVYRGSDILFFNSGPFTQVHFDYAANELGVLLSLWSYSGQIVKYPSAIIRLTGFPYGS